MKTAPPVFHLCETLEWDSRFFGRPIARVVAKSLSPDEAEAVRKWAVQEGITTVYFLVASSSYRSIWAAESVGFRLMDVRMTYEQHMASGSSTADVTTRAAMPADLPALESIAGSGFPHSRFATDPTFGSAEAGRLYQEWVRNSVNGWAERVLVADRDGTVAGFVTCHLSGGLGRIGLIAVHPSYQARGVGKNLVRAALAWFASENASTVEVVTQGANTPAQKLYSHLGFDLAAVDLWYHWSLVAPAQKSQ